MKCAIYGAGSLGTILGAYMTKNGVPVELVNRNKAHVAALNEHGAQITGTVEMTVPVTAITPDQMVGPYDVVLLLTKQLYNKDVAAFLKPLLAENGVLVTLQNGLPEPGIEEVLGKGHTMGCVVEWGATMTEPGHCVLTTEPDALSFHMGKMDGITDDQVAMVKNLLEKMCPVHIEDNLMGARWSKLLINATFSGLGTVMGGTFGTVTGDKLGRKIAVRAMKECLDVGWAAGVAFAPVQGKNIAALFYYRNAFKKALSILLVPIAMKKHKNIEPSMLQDLRNGKPCEVDAINGIVCDYGDKHRVATPVNRRIVQIIKQKQSGKLPWDKNCIDMFRDLA